ncbi:peptide/nickel transport system permease protein [Propionibacterium cyclohexanicum]|uniref:Peptide/nickel transport system permease protein n=1 Tax=Propionibacterium cyclohexanicum TaxID=64702 RepID=A0A1H9QZ31_9ACTN|nr:ABC transporter permease [Propionibacterium cyclohexanicum]SER65515.1 peptide/nickel transport system permease protein [Propionibacterium cyclohexanicum]
MRVASTIARELLIFAATLLVTSLIIFMVVNLLPGDVAGTILGPNADASSIAALRTTMGLDRPWPLRYLEWIGGLLTGDAGRSALSGQPVLALIGPKLAVTGWLVTLGMALAIVIAVPVGIAAALRRKHLDGLIWAGLSQLGMAVPAFLAGMLLVVVFAVQLSWLPANGYVRLAEDPGGWARHLVLPVVSLAIVQSAVLVRYVRSAFIDVLGEDYFRTARAVGWRFGSAVLRHGLRNASLQVLTVLGLQLATLFVGAIVIENVFVLPGLGSLLLSSVNQRDLPVVQTIVMIQVALVLVINGVVDLVARLADPRLRAEATEAGA